MDDLLFIGGDREGRGHPLRTGRVRRAVPRIPLVASARPARWAAQATTGETSSPLLAGLRKKHCGVKPEGASSSSPNLVGRVRGIATETSLALSAISVLHASVDRTTLPQAKAALRKALDSGRVIVRVHATADKGGLRRYSETQILAELEVASHAGHVGQNHSAPGRFVAYGAELVISFIVEAPNVVVVTVFEQGG